MQYAREWIVARGRLLTCGRPGRGTYAAGSFPRDGVPDSVLRQWIDGLSLDAAVHIVSLLGQKDTGLSEFAFYPFRSAVESNRKPTLQQWLDSKKANAFHAHEFPTTDFKAIQWDTLRAITARVESLLAEARTVILMDSAGAVRTKQVREALGFAKLKAKLTPGCR